MRLGQQFSEAYVRSLGEKKRQEFDDYLYLLALNVQVVQEKIKIERHGFSYN